MISRFLFHHPERQLLWHSPINNGLMSLSIRGTEKIVCCFSPLFQVWFCRVAEMLFRLLFFPTLLASVTAWNSRAPGKYSGWWPQKSEQNANFHAFEVSQVTPVLRNCMLYQETWPLGSKSGLFVTTVAQGRASELQFFTPLMHCLHQGAQLAILRLH